MLHDDNHVDDLVLDRSDLWCVCLGSPAYAGEQIVRDIVNRMKMFKYLPATTRNCIGT